VDKKIHPAKVPVKKMEIAAIKKNRDAIIDCGKLKKIQQLFHRPAKSLPTKATPEKASVFKPSGTYPQFQQPLIIILLL
jgi:hypothetical protein